MAQIWEASYTDSTRRRGPATSLALGATPPGKAPGHALAPRDQQAPPPMTSQSPGPGRPADPAPAACARPLAFSLLPAPKSSEARRHYLGAGRRACAGLRANGRVRGRRPGPPPRRTSPPTALRSRRYSRKVEAAGPAPIGPRGLAPAPSPRSLAGPAAPAG